MVREREAAYGPVVMLTVETITPADIRALRESPGATVETRNRCTQALLGGSIWAREFCVQTINLTEQVDAIFSRISTQGDGQ